MPKGYRLDKESLQRVSKSVHVTEGLRRDRIPQRGRPNVARTPEIRLGELVTALNPGSSCLVQWLVKVDDAFVASSEEPVTCWDRIGDKVGEPGDRCHFVWNWQANEFWILQLFCG